MDKKIHLSELPLRCENWIINQFEDDRFERKFLGDDFHLNKSEIK